MGMFDDMLKGDESLFLDSMPLDVDFMPPIVKHREQEQQYIAECLKPLFHNRSGKNLVIISPPGLGKTVATKHILSELEKESTTIKTIYINCWKKDTPYKVAVELCHQVGFKFIGHRDTSELLQEAAKILNKQPCVIVLDESDKIEDEQLFYTLFEDIFTKALICITNDKDWLGKLDGRVRSRMLAEILEFKPYNYDELAEILKERVSYAFVPQVFSDEAFDLIVDKVAELGDVRSGLFLMKQAGEEAESQSKRKIELGHAELALSKLDEFQRRSTAHLSDEERFMITVIKKHSGKSSRDMHELYKKEGGRQAYTTFQRKLKQLSNAGFITVKEVNEGKGRSSKVFHGSAETTLKDFL